MTLSESLPIWAGYEPARCHEGAMGFEVLVGAVMVPATDITVLAAVELACSDHGWTCDTYPEEEGADNGYWGEITGDGWIEREHGTTRAESIVPAYTEALQSAGIV